MAASVLAHAPRARVAASPAAPRAIARRAVVNTIGKPFSIEKLLMLDYTTSDVVEWFVPRVETGRVGSWCPSFGSLTVGCRAPTECPLWRRVPGGRWVMTLVRELPVWR